VLLDIDMVGARNIDALEERLRRRGDTSEADIARRLDIARKVMEEAPGVFDHFVVNDGLEAAIERVAGILEAVPDPGGTS
jgi:guanylate kinase